jgi:uncharacterized membrane protein YraQ (UPF0718 family)
LIQIKNFIFTPPEICIVSKTNNVLSKINFKEDNTMILKIIDIIFSGIIGYVIDTLYHNWHYLLISILIAVGLAVYINPDKLKSLFLRRSKLMIFGSVGFGAFTPLCACGTMAIIISLLTTALPWGPVMAFLVSSPLMSPDTFVLISGFLGVNFAIALAVTSVLLGLAAGYLTYYIEMKSGFLNGQLRFINQNTSHTEQLINMPVSGDGCSCGCSMKQQLKQGVIVNITKKLRLKLFMEQFYSLGIRKIIPLFILFVVVAYLVKTYVPAEWIVALFGSNRVYSVPLAAFIGLPLYVSDASVVPLLQVFQSAGANHGALLAFMIAGPGTSLGVLGELSLIVKKKVMFLYIVFIFAGAVLSGYIYDGLLMFFK